MRELEKTNKTDEELGSSQHKPQVSQRCNKCAELSIFFFFDKTLSTSLVTKKDDFKFRKLAVQVKIQQIGGKFISK